MKLALSLYTKASKGHFFSHKNKRISYPASIQLQKHAHIYIHIHRKKKSISPLPTFT